MQINSLYSLITTLRNSQKANKNYIIHPYTRTLLSVTTILYKEGFIRGFFLKQISGKKNICILLKYKDDQAVIKEISTDSFPKSNFSVKQKEIMKKYNGKGLTLLSTNIGIITNETAFKKNRGGKILFKIK